MATTTTNTTQAPKPPRSAVPLNGVDTPTLFEQAKRDHHVLARLMAAEAETLLGPDREHAAADATSRADHVRALARSA